MTTTTGSFGTTLQGTLGNNVTDTIKLTANAAGAVTIDFQHPDGPGTNGLPFDLQLLDSLGNVLVKNRAQGNLSFETTIASAGDYYLKVIDVNTVDHDAPGNYSVTATLDGKVGATYDGGANNTSAKALTATLGAPIVGSMMSRDTDYFKVHADTGGVMKLDFVHPNGAGTTGAPIAIELSDAAGNLVIKTNTAGNTVLQTTVAGAGDYFVKVVDGNEYDNEDGGLYTLTPTLTSAAGTTYDGAANNTSAAAIASPMGATIAGSLNARDTDYFKVHADAGGIVKLDFVHPYGAGASDNAIAIELLDAAGNSIIRTNTGGNTVLTATVAEAGDYYLQITDGNVVNAEDGGIYKLTPSFTTLDGVAYDGAVNNSSTAAAHAALPGAIAGSLNKNDTDYFSFNAKSAGTLSVNFVHPAGLGTSSLSIGLAIVDAKGNTVVSKYELGSELFTAVIPSAGDYFVKVSDGAPYSDGHGGIYSAMLGFTGNGGSAVRGTAGADRLSGSSGDDVIDGGAGTDVVSYRGNAADYKIAISAAGVSVIDTTGKDGADTLFNVERLSFADHMVSLDTNGAAAQAYRIYQAAFDRAPDAGGLGYWIANMEKGMSVAAVANAFIASQEFRDMYGAQPGNRDMVAKFYTNVLHRAPDDAGLDFWVKALDSHAIDAATALSGFSESAENIAQLAGTISHGIHYLPFG